MAISTISPYINETTGNVNTYFGIATCRSIPACECRWFPTTATIGAGETMQFTATVTGTTNQGVTGR